MTTLAEECERLGEKATEAEAWAAAKEAAADRAAENQDWFDRLADACDRSVERLQRYLETLERQAREYRELAEDARSDAERNRERDERFPGEGWDDAAGRDAERARERDENARRLEEEAREIRERIERRKRQAEELRNRTEEASEEAEIAAGEAARARRAHERCRERLAAEEDHEEGTADETGATESPEEPPPDYCGPDVTVSYLAALRRVHRRMRDVPDGERGSLDGTLFLKRNGWSIDQWPDPAVSVFAGGVECPSGDCAGEGNPKGQHFYMLFGVCVPAHVLNDIMYGFTAHHLEVPRFVQNLGAHWADAEYNLKDRDFGEGWRGHLRAMLEFADPEISQKSYELGGELAEAMEEDEPLGGSEIGEKLDDGWLDFLDTLETAYPDAGGCDPCPGNPAISRWRRDWSRATWTLGDGTELDYGPSPGSSTSER